MESERRRQQRPAVVEQDDHFHVLREGRRALRATASAARRPLDKAVRQERRGRRLWGRRAAKAHACDLAYYWRVAERAFDVWGQQERVWNVPLAPRNDCQNEQAIPQSARRHSLPEWWREATPWPPAA